MKKINLLLIIFFILTGCDSRPEYTEVVDNFHQNKDAFQKLAENACELGHINSKKYYVIKIDGDDVGLTHNPDEIIDEIKTIGAYFLRYINVKNTCTLELGYFSRGFAGDSLSFNYTYNIPIINPYDASIHNWDAVIRKSKISPDPIKFQMQLEKNWSFSFAYQ